MVYRLQDAGSIGHVSIMAMQGQRFSSSWPVRPRRLPVKKGLDSSPSILASLNYHSEAIIRLFSLPPR